MTEPREFKLADAGSYDHVAERFDELSVRYTAPFVAKVLELAHIAAGERVLDVGTGTGLCALAAAPEAGPTGSVVGIDLSDGMLETARHRAEAQARAVEFRRMDAEALALPDRSIDVVVSLFALMHFPAPEIALSEMRRVLKPRGRLVLAAGSGPPLLSIDTLKRLIEVATSRFGNRREMRAPDALDELVDRVLPVRRTELTTLATHGHGSAVRIDGLVRAAGFVVRRTHWEPITTPIPTAEEFWDVQRTFSSRARKRLADAAPADAESVRTQLLEMARLVQAKGGRLVYRRAAFFVVAERPADS